MRSGARPPLGTQKEAGGFIHRKEYAAFRVVDSRVVYQYLEQENEQS